MRINKTDENITDPMLEKELGATAMEVEPDNQTRVSKDDEFDENDYSRPQATFQFKIENFSKFTKQSLSPPCYIRNLPWKILALVRSQERGPNTVNRFLGYFLQCNAESESQTWSCQAGAVLKVLAQDKEKGVDYCKQISHLFFFKENDWGYNQFLSFRDLMDPEKGYYKDDSIILEVSVRAEAPHGVSWDSKKHTGYVGLKNQGATCYMNSILQTLFFTNQLRRDVYQIPTEGDDAGKSVALALQRVFYELQTSDKPVGTKKVTKSFGWETLDSFMQHDVQEFCRVLLDKIESKMKGSLVEGRIPKLFEGKMVSYIKCKNVDYCSSCTEAFYDIQLNVKDMKNIYESFRQYINPQTLDGENKYDAGEHGLQEAEKGVKFVSFPPVLHLQLMRYEYDPNLDTNVKINDRFEFPVNLHLDEFLDKPESTPANYILHAVLVHSGDNHGGHYVVYIDPRADGKWCKFDDDVVSRCARREAVDANFGGTEAEIAQAQHALFADANAPQMAPTGPILNSSGSLARNTSNAYMLVYVRESAKNQVLKPVTEADIPILLVERLKEEKRVELIKRKEKNEAHFYFNIDIFLEENFYGHLGHDLFDTSSHTKRTFKIKRNCIYKDLIKEIASYMKFSPDQIRIWPLFKRSNTTIRFANVDSDNDNKKLNDFIGGDTWTIYLETVTPDTGQTSLPPFDEKSQVLFFFKYYEPKLKVTFYCGHAYADLQKSLNDLAPMLRKRAGLPENTPLLYYEEISFTTTNAIHDTQGPIGRAIGEILNGDIIVFQRDTPDLASYPYPTPCHYFSDIYNHIDMIFTDKNKPTDPGFKISLSMLMPYQDAMQTVANYIGTEKRLLQFFTTNPYRDTPQNPIKSSFSGKFGDIFNVAKVPPVHKIFYQKLCMPLDELEAKTQYKCLWVPHHPKEEKELILYVNKSATVSDLLEDAKKKILNSFYGSGISKDGNGGRGSPNVALSNLAQSNSSLGNSNSHSPLITNSDYFDSPNPLHQLKLRVVDIQSFKHATLLKPEIKLETYLLEQQSHTGSGTLLNTYGTSPNNNLLNSNLNVSPILGAGTHLNPHTPISPGAASLHNLIASANPLRIEEVPCDQRDMAPDEILVPCAHFYRVREIVNNFGIPFFIKVKNDEHFESIKSKIQQKLDLSDKEFEKIKFYFVSQGRVNEIPNTDCRISINDLKMARDVWIGLEHQNKMAKQSRTSYMEKPIKIHN